ncbi:hypothetical protein GGP41_000397 [Bipolaris sorokiniana]|uniref:DUF3295 domain-containing protein n=1 Tax=Cochliobolus sativus TaxID=45130 RepID=A0A8H6DQ92_COCSA|nr:hypothetical protein GGP41_000397 [Bipolaris sorokiniana]
MNYGYNTNTIPLNTDVNPPTSQDDIDESAIEEEDSGDGGWEDDDDEESSTRNFADLLLFRRVDSMLNPTSRQSLLTSALRGQSCESVLQNTPSQHSPAICHSRIRLPTTPSTSNSPQENSGLTMKPTQASRSNLIIMDTFNVHPPTSPKATRRNMLNSELTKSLQQNLLWERQQKNVTANAVAKRQQSAANPPILRRALTTGDLEGL